MGILDQDQDQIMNRMTDAIIRQRIQEYCIHSFYKKHRAADPHLTVTKVDKDDKGWYVETKSIAPLYLTWVDEQIKSFYDYCSAREHPIDKQKGFLIRDNEGPDTYFRWHKHEGGLRLSYTPGLESTEGLPEELDRLMVCCCKSGKLEVLSKINVLVVTGIYDLEIFGDGYKSIVVRPYRNMATITTPAGSKLYHPTSQDEYIALMRILEKFPHI